MQCKIFIVKQVHWQICKVNMKITLGNGGSSIYSLIENCMYIVPTCIINFYSFDFPPNNVCTFYCRTEGVLQFVHASVDLKLVKLTCNLK